jgi:hypothetical protein
MQTSGDLTAPLGGSEILRGVDCIKKSATDGSSVLEQVCNCFSRHFQVAVETSHPHFLIDRPSPGALNVYWNSGYGFAEDRVGLNFGPQTSSTMHSCHPVAKNKAFSFFFSILAYYRSSSPSFYHSAEHQ